MASQKYPEPTVGALIFNSENKLFLMTSPKWRGKYVGPGGHIEVGETIKEALKREIKEETNLDIFNIKFISVQEFIFGKEFHQRKHFIFLDYACRTDSKDVVLNNEGKDYVWVSLEEALSLPLEPYTRNTILKFKEKYIDKNGRFLL